MSGVNVSGACKRAGHTSVGVSADPVWRLVVERALIGSRPGRRSDGARVALAIEGGGMAGAVSAGMCAALEALNLIQSFDVIYGTSSGAINASYTAAGQARLRAGLYPLAARQRLIDPRGTLRGDPPFKIAEIFTSLLLRYPLAPTVLDAQPSLRVTATCTETKALDALGDFTCLDELRTAVWASCASPILAGAAVELRGRRYADGGLIESIPFGIALHEGATHVLALRTRSEAHRKRELTGASRQAWSLLLRSAPETVVEMVREWPALYNAQASALQHPERVGLAGRVAQLAPPVHVRSIETRPGRLFDAIAVGARTVYRTLASGASAGLGSQTMCGVSRTPVPAMDRTVDNWTADVRLASTDTVRRRGVGEVQ
jgi:predicted patatin/cPLA2 family phospholipase